MQFVVICVIFKVINMKIHGQTSKRTTLWKWTSAPVDPCNTSSYGHIYPLLRLFVRILRLRLLYTQQNAVVWHTKPVLV